MHAVDNNDLIWCCAIDACMHPYFGRTTYLRRRSWAVFTFQCILPIINCSLRHSQRYVSHILMMLEVRCGHLGHVRYVPKVALALISLIPVYTNVTGHWTQYNVCRNIKRSVWQPVHRSGHAWYTRFVQHIVVWQGRWPSEHALSKRTQDVKP